MRVVAHARRPKGHTALNHKKKRKNPNQRPRNHPHGCKHGHGARLWKEPTRNLRSDLQHRSTTKQKQFQHSRVANNVFNTNLSATTASDLHATKIVNVRQRGCALPHFTPRTSQLMSLACAFRNGSEQESSAQKPWGLATQHVSNTLPDMFFLTIKHRISPNHRPTLQ